MTEEKLTYTPADLLDVKVAYPYPYFKKVTVTIHRIYGCCPISVEGDKWVFDHKMLHDESKETFDVPNIFEPHHRFWCETGFHSLMYPMRAMHYGISAVDLGIAKSGEDGYVMCPAWGPPTCEAAVIYRLHAEPIKKGFVDRFYEYMARQGHVSVPTFYLEKFASAETKANREKKIQEWRNAGSPKFWEGWRNPSCQPQPKN